MGSLIDALPYVMLGDEVRVLEMVQQGKDRAYIFERLRERSKRGARQPIKYLWQGCCKELRVIGVKPQPPLAWYWHKGRYRVGRAVVNAQAIGAAVGVPMRFIHPLRNPYDIIAAWDRHNWARPLEASAEMFFETFDECMAVRALGHPWLDVRLEDLIYKQEETLVALCEFLGQEVPEEYVWRCRNRLYVEPHLRRGEVTWTPELIARVADGIAERDLLEGYRYDD